MKLYLFFKWLGLVLPWTLFPLKSKETLSVWCRRQIDGLIIVLSGLFESEWYLQNYPDVAREKASPLLHYLRSGTFEGRSPNRFFDQLGYLAQNPDVAVSGTHPLVHFHLHGWREGRQPSSLFDVAGYLQVNADVAKADIDPLQHYLVHGEREGRSPRPLARPHHPSIPLITYDPATDGTITLPTFDSIEVSIIIPAHNQFRLTMGTIKAINEHTKGIAYEVILVDDVSSDEVGEIERYVKNLKVIRNTSNLGFLKNCNLAAAQAAGKFLVLLNSDTNVQDEWLLWLLKIFEQYPDAGMAGPLMLFDDGSVQEAGVVVYNNAQCWCIGRNEGNPFRPEYRFVREVDYISGACLIVDKSVWDRLGGFDEFFAPAYSEDVDLAFRVRQAQYKVYFQPKAIVVHFEGKSYGEGTGTRHQLMEKNRQRFAQRWKNVLTSQHVPPPADHGQPEDLFLARDRSFGTSHIFVTDIWVPEHDHNAGARCTRQYLELFLEMGLKVTFYPRDNQRREPYATELEQLGIEVLLDVDIAKWMEMNLRYFDYLYLHRPDSSVLLDVISKYRKPEAKILYFAHDLHHLRLRRQHEIDPDPALLAQADEIEKSERMMFAAADSIHVVGEYEAHLIQNEYKDKPVRNIPLFIFNDFESHAFRLGHERNNLLFVGGFGHPPNVDAVNWFISEVWPDFSIRHPKVELFIVGSRPTQEILAYDSERVHVTGYVNDDRLKSYYSECRLLIIPLRYGAGVKGKVLEGMYHHIPVITTPVGAEGIPGADEALIVQPWEEGWSNAISRWYDSPGELDRKANRAYDVIVRQFSSSHAMDTIRQDMKGAK